MTLLSSLAVNISNLRANRITPIRHPGCSPRIRLALADHSTVKRFIRCMGTQSPTDQPGEGDILITTEDGIHFLSVVPHEPRLSFRDLSHAINVALTWA